MSYQDFGSALSVSFLSIAAGSAFGLWTGVGAQTGILTMAVASIFGVFFGGAPVKTSGPTGPTAALMFASLASLAAVGADPQYISICLLVASVLLFILSYLPVHKLINYVPYTSMAVFVNGVSLLIIYKQLLKLWGFQQLEPALFWWESGIAIGAFAVLTIWPKMNQRFKFVPGIQIVSGSLLAMAMGAAVVALFSPGVNTLSLTTLSISSFVPDWSFSETAVPVLALLIVTLKITAVITFVTLVTAKALYEAPMYAQEMKNQGMANFVVALIGGIPVTLGFIRTKILQKNGAKSILSGVLVGLFIISILVFFKPFLDLIPTSVFIGILIRAGLSSLDFQAWHELRKTPKTALLPFLFVLTGSLAIVFYDLVFVLLASILIWKVASSIQSTKDKCHDLEKCPCLD